jgi:dienelactone hydrolase
MASEPREPLPPDRMTVRAGSRPDTEFGHDDIDADAELVVLQTADHKHWDALLMRPRQDVAGRADTLAVIVHGSLGNFMGGVPRRLAFELAHHGYAALSVNTRMANFGVIYGGGLFDETPHDLEAALAFARQRGFSRVILVGYSLGASIATHYQATRRPLEVVGLCTLAHPWSLPESIRRRWTMHRSQPSYTEVERLALRAGVDREGNDDVVIIRRGAGETDAPCDTEAWSLRAWWQSRGPEAANATSVQRIRDVGVPVALIQAGADPVLPGSDGENLQEAARAAGLDCHLEHIAGADHTFWGLGPEAAERAVVWMDSLPRAAEATIPPRVAAATTARLVTIPGRDGSRHDAILEMDLEATAARTAQTGRRTAIVHLHGNQGSLTVGALRFLRRPVAGLGIPILSLDTRIGSLAQLFGTAIFPDVLEDVRAAVGWLAEEGFDRAIVSGYSLGGTAAAYAAADDLGLPLAGMLGLGTAWSLPESSRARMNRCGAAPSYEELVSLCRPYAAASPEEDVSLVVHRMYLPDDAPHAAGVYTARTWWHSRGPEAEAAMACRQIGRIRAPILLVQGTADAIVDPGDAARLAEQARREGNGDVTVAMLEGEGHGFADHEATFAAIRDWLDRVA